MWQELWPWLIGAVVVFLGGVALWQVLRGPRRLDRPTVDLHAAALEHWLAGRLDLAREHLRELIQRQPESTDPYLQLGTLYRLTGDPGRAAAMHRSLAVRPDLTPARRITIGLELAADLVELARWQEADEVLAQLADGARKEVRWYRLRFAAGVGSQQPPMALRALRDGEKALVGDEAAELRQLRAAWMTDRALVLARGRETQAAREALAQVKGLDEAAGRAYLVRALIARSEDDPDAAVRAVEQGLADHPVEMAPALLTLEEVLAEAGRFMRVIPILEAACRRDDTPPSIWMALARLYEKLGRRDDAIRLLAGKRGDPRLTPDAAAPYLRLLTSEAPDSAFTKVWNLLGDPQRTVGFRCRHCGHREPDLRWFCEQCLSPDGFEAVEPPPLESAEHSRLSEPPRY